ncbi:hypothetical protein N9L71_12625 [Verrucomicrobiales bacterium]|nr:hypothetical protein [Verrucomicrobiales bacterium]
MAIDFEKLWKLVINAPNNRSGHTIHGPDHWLRVERNECILANRTCPSAPALGTLTGFTMMMRRSESVGMLTD